MKKNELLLFHIHGGGGNNKRIEFYSMGGITDCPEWNDLFTQEDEEGVITLTDCNGNELMDAEEYNKAITTGVGRLEIDGDYNTWYTCPLDELNDEEFYALDEDVKEIYLKEIFHYSDEDLDGEDLNDIYAFGLNE
jgi:hypothetical protein